MAFQEDFPLRIEAVTAASARERRPEDSIAATPTDAHQQNVRSFFPRMLVFLFHCKDLSFCIASGIVSAPVR